MPRSTASETDPRPAIQLHTVRALDEPLPETIRRVAEAGFDGVEFAGRFLESDPRSVHTALETTDTVPVAAHVDLSRLDRDLESIADRCRRVGCDHVIIPHLGGEHFRTVARVDSLARRLDDLAGRLGERGLQLSYHTSRHPFLPMLDQFGLGKPAALPIPDLVWRVLTDGIEVLLPHERRLLDRTGLAHLASRTDDLTFEIDVGWVAATGYDPVDVFELLDGRTSLIHLADVEQVGRFPPSFRSVPVGRGLLDVERVGKAARRAGMDWIVYEDDDPADPVEAIQRGMTAVAPFVGPDRSIRADAPSSTAQGSSAPAALKRPSDGLPHESEPGTSVKEP